MRYPLIEEDLEAMRKLLRPMRMAQVARESGLSAQTVDSFINKKHAARLETALKIRAWLASIGALDEKP